MRGFLAARFRSPLWRGHALTVALRRGTATSSVSSTPGTDAPDARTAGLFVPPTSATTYAAQRADGRAALVELASAPYSPHTAVVLVDALELLRRELAAPILQLQREGDHEALVALVARFGAAIAEIETVGATLASPASTKGVPRLLDPAGFFAVGRDMVVKAETAAAARATANRREDDDAFQGERVAHGRLEAATVFGSDAALPDLHRAAVRIVAVASALPASHDRSAMLLAASRLLGCIAETLQGTIAAAAALGNWQSAVAAHQELRKADATRAQLLAQCGSTPLDANVTDDEATAIVAAESVETPAQRVWRVYESPMVQAKATQTDASSAGTLTRVVRACAAAKEFDVAHHLCQEALSAAIVAASTGSGDGGGLDRDRQIAVAQRTLSGETLTALASSIACKRHLDDFRGMFAASAGDILAHIPVSVELYSTLIDACATCTDEPARLQLGLSFYRGIRDHELVPTEVTYGALTGLAASVGDADSAISFLHEARSVLGGDAIPAPVYAGVLQAFARAGYGEDARRSLEVLVERGAPLTREAFHAAMAKTSYDDAMDTLATMTGPGYEIAPTAATYAFVLRAAARARSVSSTDRLLMIADTHAKCAALLRHDAAVEEAVSAPLLTADGGTDTGGAAAVGALPGSVLGSDPRATDFAAALQAVPDSAMAASPSGAMGLFLQTRKQWDYICALTHALRGVSVSLPVAVLLAAGRRRVQHDAEWTAAAGKTFKGLCGVSAGDTADMYRHVVPAVEAAQDAVSNADAEGGIFAQVRSDDHMADGDDELPPMNLAPQHPTRLPTPKPVVAVLSGDVLCSGAFEAVLPVVHQLSSVVIPFSALAQLRDFVQRNAAQRVDLLERSKHAPAPLMSDRSSRGIAVESSFARDEAPEVRARAAVNSLRKLVQVAGGALHVGSLAEDLAAWSFNKRFALTHRPDGERGQKRSMNEDAGRSLQWGLRAAAVAAALAHPGALEDASRTARALSRVGLLATPDSVAAGNGGEFPGIALYHRSAAKVVFVTRDAVVRSRVTSLGHAVKRLHKERALQRDPAASSLPFKKLQDASNAFSLSACLDAVAPTREAIKSARKAPVPELLAQSPDVWPAWLVKVDSEGNPTEARRRDGGGGMVRRDGPTVGDVVKATAEKGAVPSQPPSTAAGATVAADGDELLRMMMLMDDDE